MSLPVQDTNPIIDVRSPARLPLSSAVRAHLLDAENWREGLATFARATSLATALVDAEGRLLGECLNPQPTWRLLHAPQANGERSFPQVGCPFSLTALEPCTCVADALAKGGLVLAHDRTGLVHFAVPLRLGEHPLGALVAGQVFDHYPEQLPLERVAKALGLLSHEVWHTARLEHPVKRTTLLIYGDLLANLGQTFLQTRYHTIVEADRLAEMTQLRDSLAEADRRKSEFLAMLGHELRNPLAPIRNAVQVLRLKGPDRADVTWAGDVIERQVQQLTRLVSDLLDVARITSGKVQLCKEPVDMAAIVARAVEISRPAIDERQQELTVALPSQPVWVEADAMRLGQVLTNLLNNAAKYTDEGGHIWLTVERALSDEVVVKVRDNGTGIAADMLPCVFDLFSQADRSLAHSQGGLGLGLTMVRSLVEMHGGRVQAASAGLGQGSEFVVSLPVLPEPPHAAEAKEERNGQSVSSSTHRILVVDDNCDAADSLGMLLRMMGHDVRVVHEGVSALAAAQTLRPEVVLLDIGLPHMDGYEVARRLREEVGLKDALLVALTGYGQADDRQRSHQAGFDHHLVKPVDLVALQELLASVESVAFSGGS